MWLGHLSQLALTVPETKGAGKKNRCHSNKIDSAKTERIQNSTSDAREHFQFSYLLLWRRIMKNMEMVVKTILFVGLLAAGLHAATSVPAGPIPAGEMWTKTGSPYLIEGDVEVPFDLTIEPGVQVVFMGDFLFVIDGTLVAEGTETEHILFTSDTGGALGKGLDFNSTASGCLLKYCDIEWSTDRGIQILNCVPVIEHCSVRHNASPSNGGGMYIYLTPGQNLVFKHCSINSNRSGLSGGGVYAEIDGGSLEFQDCTINGNKTGNNYYGGGLYVESGNVLFTGDSEVSLNEVASSNYNYTGCSSTSCGGGIFVARGFLSLTCCTVDSNVTYAYADAGGNYGAYAYSYGAGIYLASAASGTLKNCQIKSNSTTGWGQNGLTLRGAGVYNSSGVLFVENCTVAFNQTDGIHDAGIGNIVNSIFYFNSGNQIGGSPTVNYCDVMGGWPSGMGIIDEDPKFTNPPGILTLRTTSLCIDAGDPDPFYNDYYFPPSQGTERNDLGYTGGPNALPLDPVPDVKVNGQDGPIQVPNGSTVAVTVSLDPGDEEGTLADWWIGATSTYGSFWLAPGLQWTSSNSPLSLGTTNIFRLKEKTAINTTLPPGSYIFFFILDAIPNGKFDCMAWYDHAVVCVLP
jgi:hypothetical protein